MQNTVYEQMENKQAGTQILPDETFENPYSEFIIDALGKSGDFFVENAINEIASQGADTSILVNGKVPDIAEVTYNNTREENYIYKIREDELLKASATTEGANELKSKIVQNLDEQDKKNCYRQFPKIISRTLDLKDTQLKYGASDTDYEQAFLDMKEDIRNIAEPSELYTAYSKRVGSKTYNHNGFSNSATIFIKASFKDALEVKYLAGVHNLQMVMPKGVKVVPVNTFYNIDASGNATVDENKLWLTCGKGYAKIFKTFVKNARLEETRGFNESKAVTYKEFVSKLVPAIWHIKGTKPTT